MQNKFTFDRSILIPAAIGILSVIGICLVLLVGSLTTRTPQTQVATETPFKYVFLGTEPEISTPLLDETQVALSASPETSLTVEGTTTNGGPIILLTGTRPFPSRVASPTATRTISTRTTITLTPTISPNFDDTDFRLIFTGDWISQTNVSGAYQSTLHISNTLQDKVSFSFLGQQLSYFYQAGPSLGTVTIAIDGLGFNIDQSQSATQIKEWKSGILINANHNVVITHVSGGSVNIDSVIITSGATATPTATATRTP